MIRRLATLLALLWLGPTDAALAQHRVYPSLAKRPVESRDRDAEIAAKAAANEAAANKPVAEDSALAARVQDLAQRAAKASSAFDSGLAAGQRSVTAAKGAAVGSEAWVVAQKAISGLDADRYDSVSALAELDTLYTERWNAEDPARALADTRTIDASRQPILTMVDAQNDRLDSLKAMLNQP
jgi:hypothetical protein